MKTNVTLYPCKRFEMEVSGVEKRFQVSRLRSVELRRGKQVSGGIRKDEHRTSNIERPTSKFEWEKMMKQTCEL